MKAAYFWVNGKIVTRDTWVSAEVARAEGLCEIPCVDAFEAQPDRRYGLFERGRGWAHIPIEQFPKAFRLELLLLGVH